MQDQQNKSFRDIPSNIQLHIFTYLPVLPYYLSLRTLNKYFRDQFSDEKGILSQITCLNLSSFNKTDRYYFLSSIKSRALMHLIQHCKNNLRTLLLPSNPQLSMKDIFLSCPRLKELTIPDSFIVEEPRNNGVPQYDRTFLSELMEPEPMRRAARQTSIETLNIFCYKREGRDFHSSRDSMHNTSDIYDEILDRSLYHASEYVTNRYRIHRMRLLSIMIDALYMFPKLKHLNVYNLDVTDKGIEANWKYIKQHMALKNEAIDMTMMGEFAKARTKVTTGREFMRLALHPTFFNEDIKLKVSPGVYQTDRTLVFDDLIRHGVSPRISMEKSYSTLRSYLYDALYYGQWRVRQVLLEKLYQKYSNEMFTWFQMDDWRTLLSGTKCSAKNFVSFFFPKFTRNEFEIILSPGCLINLGDTAYPVIKEIPNFDFDVKTIPRLLTYTERAPQLYQLFCDLGCSLPPSIIPKNYLDTFTRPCVLFKVLEHAASSDANLSQNMEFKTGVLGLIHENDEQLALLAFDKLGAESVRTYANMYGNTYLHVALYGARLELARTMIQRYGIHDVNQVNNINQDTILHAACSSIRAIPNMIEELLELPGIKLHLKNRHGQYAYDVMLATLKVHRYPISLYKDILQKIKPQQAIELEELCKEVSAKRTNNDDDYQGPKRKRFNVHSNYSRAKCMKLTTDESNTTSKESEDESESTCNTKKEKPVHRMSLRERTKKYSSYPPPV